MKFIMRRVLGVILLATALGCAAHNRPATLPSSAFFAADSDEQASLRALRVSHETYLKNCRDALACEDASYARALIALFENRADAINAFQELYTTSPEGQHAASSKAWLALLQDIHPVSFRQSPQFLQLKQDVLRSLLDHDNLTASRGLLEYERRMGGSRQEDVR
jgi:hypothetical protein